MRRFQAYVGCCAYEGDSAGGEWFLGLLDFEKWGLRFIGRHLGKCWKFKRWRGEFKKKI